MAFDELWPIAVVLLAGFLPNEVWRLLGLAVGQTLREDSRLFLFLKCVSTAVLAAVVAQLVLTPPGQLALVPAVVRIGAVACGLVAYALTGGSVMTGGAVAIACLVAASFGLTGPFTR